MFSFSRLPAKASKPIKKPPRAGKKPTPIGTDHAVSLPTPQGKTLQLSYWDLWFALIAARDSAGDLLRLAQQLAGDKLSCWRDSVCRPTGAATDASHAKEVVTRPPLCPFPLPIVTGTLFQCR